MQCVQWIGEDPAHEVTKDAVRLERCVFFEPIVVGCNIEIFIYCEKRKNDDPLTEIVVF